MRVNTTAVMTVLLGVANATEAGSILRFEHEVYEVAPGTTELTLTILYDLEAGVVGDTFFDLSANDGPGGAVFDLTFSNYGMDDENVIPQDLDAIGTAIINPTPGIGSISIISVSRSTPYLYDPALTGSGAFNTPAAEFAFSTNLLQANQGANDPLTDMMLPAGIYPYADITVTIPEPSTLGILLVGATVLVSRPRLRRSRSSRLW